MTDRSQAVAVAVAMAATARQILVQAYRQKLATEAKADLSPVTAADRAVEGALRQMIAQHFPDHGVLGEEYGEDRLDAEQIWVLDPIDGTKAFISGNPLFGTLIALVDRSVEERGAPVVGVIDMPILGESWLGADDRGASCNGVAVRARACATLGEALLYATSPDMFDHTDRAAFNRLSGAVRYPLYGANCYGYAMLAGGTTDLVCEAQLQPYDYCACAAIVQAAGGVAVDWRGQPLTMLSGDKVLMAGDPALIAPALARLCVGNGVRPPAGSPA